MPQDKIDNISAKRAYADAVIYGPSPKLEQIIALNAYYSYWYAQIILDGRFPAGEQAILKDQHYIFLYVTTVMHRRWLKAEPIIRKSQYWNDCKEYFNIK